MVHPSAHSLATVEAVEQLLCDGLTKTQISLNLSISRHVVDRISWGKHPQQSQPGAFLARYAISRCGRAKRTKHGIISTVVEAAQNLLCEGIPKMRVGRELGLSRSVVEKIAAGKHVRQTEPSEFLERYSRRPKPEHRVVCPHAHSLEVVERVEALLCHYWREQYDRSSSRRFSLQSIADEIGVGRRVIDHVIRRCHPAQLARDGKPQAHFRSERLPSGAFAHTKETVEVVTGLIADGDYTQNAICMTLRMSPRTVRKIQKSTHFQQVGPVVQAIRTQHMTRRERRPKSWVPSPRRISRLCEQIRRAWTPEEEAARYCGRRYWSPEPQSLAC